jgi:hypothetical protein
MNTTSIGASGLGASKREFPGAVDEHRLYVARFARSVVIWALAAGGALFSALAAASDSVSTINNGCSDSYVYAGATALFPTVISASSIQILAVDQDRDYLNGVFQRACNIETTQQMDDSADLPTGTTDNPETSTWDQIINAINQFIKRNHLFGPTQHQGPAVPTTVTPTGTRGLHGSIYLSGGWVLSTGTPGYASFLASSLTQTTYVPFVVESGGTGASLSIYGPPGGVLWSQPLSLFTPGKLYFAVIPAQTTDASQQLLLTYWLHSPTSGSPAVYFPDQFQTLVCPAATAQAGIPYSSTLTATGGIPPYIFSNGAALPPGLTLDTSTGAVTGTPTISGPFSFAVQVTDSSGLSTGTLASNCTITVSPASDFSISTSPGSVSLASGGAGTSVVTTTGLNGFSNSIALATTGVPAGASATFSASSITGSGGSTLTISAGTAAAGMYTINVTGTSGTLAHTTTITLIISSVSQLSVTPSSLSFGTVPRFSLLYKAVTLKNLGTTAVSISKVSITPGAGTDRGDFIAISLCGSSLAAARSCPIYVVLFASDLGSLSAILNIPNNAVGSPQTVPLNVTVTPHSRPFP